MKKRSSSQTIRKPTVKTKGTQERVTIGMDLGDKTSRSCMLSNEGVLLSKVRITLDLLDERRFANGMVYLRYHAQA